MIIAIDTYYFENKAKTVAIAFDKWEDESYALKYIEVLNDSSKYIPGEFYKRELPCILSILKKFDFNLIDVIVVDSFVFLDDDNKFGLGGHLYESLDQKIPIIGVAKTNFATIQKNKLELLRGESKNPLYITSVGIDLQLAKDNISKMSGSYRFPKLLKELDQLTKENSESNLG